jgi:hypothetical protein
MDTGFALAGDTVLFSRDREDVTAIYTMPVDASAAPVERLREPTAVGLDSGPAMSGSGQRVAISLDSRVEGGTVQHLFGGPPTGPWTELVPPARFDQGAFASTSPEVDGDRLFTVELRMKRDVFRRIVREGAAPPRELGRTTEDVRPVAYAGDFEAYVEGFKRVVVRNWRTGEQRVLAVPGPDSVDVREDGAVLVSGDDIRVVSPSGEVTRISEHGYGARWAGDRIVYEDNSRLLVVEPGGRPRRVGVPTVTLNGWDVDTRRVLWAANGCLLVADLTAPPETAPGPGPCPRTELAAESVRKPKVGRDRKVRVFMRCVAAVGACRGRLRVEQSTTGGFSIPVGRSGHVVVRLTRSAYAAARRKAKREGGQAGLVVHGVTIDPGGVRHGIYDLWLGTVR